MNPVEVQLIETSVLNAASILMTLCVIISYCVFKRRYPVAMSRKTLLISTLMASCDLVTACFNFVGFTPNLPGAACGVVGGFFFAVPMLASTFYACSVALNCLLVFVLRIGQRRWLNQLYIYAPPSAALAIGVSGLSGSMYGLDGYWGGQCWYRTDGVSRKMYLVRKLLTWTLPVILVHTFLIISSAIILVILVRRRNDHGQYSFGSAESQTPVSETIAASRARRTEARRALILRLLAYIFIAIICVLPLVILDSLFYLSVSVPHNIVVAAFGLSSCFGLLNGLIYCLDPTILGIFDLIRRGDFKKNAHRRRSASQHNLRAVTSDDVTIEASVEEHALQPLERVTSDETKDSRRFFGGLPNFWPEKRGHLGDADGHEQTKPGPRIVVFVEISTESNSLDALSRDLYDL